MNRRTLNNLFSPSFLVIHSTLAFGTGIILGRPDFPFPTTLLITTFFLGMTCLLSLSLAKKLSHALAIIFFLLVGVCHGNYALAPPLERHHIANLVSEQREVTLIGTIDNALAYGVEKTTLVIESSDILIPSPANLAASATVQASPMLQRTTGLVKISMRGKPSYPFLPGDRVLIRAKIGPPQGFDNPGGFNLPLFLASQDIFISGWISSPQAMMRLDELPTKNTLIRYGPERLRARLIGFLRLHLPEKQSALYRALITGDRTGLPPELVELFRSLGIVHLLAISGLHMALLAGAVMTVTFWLLQRSEHILLHGSAQKISAGAAIIPLILYCLIAGFQTPALRALLMILIFISALLSDRQWHGPTNVSLAALLILISNPLAITTVSFQLSFAAVTGIILILPHARTYFVNNAHTNLKTNILRYATGSLVVSLAASLATLPLLLYHFNRFTLSGPLATIVIEPFLCMWALGWGLPASLLAPLFPNLAQLLFTTGGWGLDISLFLAEKLQPLVKSIWLPTPSPLQIVFFYIGLFVFITTKKTWLRVSAALCCLSLFILVPHKLTTDQATILDVGHGNCTLIETTSGKVVVVDAGGPHAPTFDIGRQVIAPALWSKGIKNIDLMILSHPDQDHYSGATFLLEHFTPRTLWVPTTDKGDPSWQKMINIAAKQHVDIHIPHGDELFPLESGRELSCLTDLHHNVGEKQNNQSLVVKFTSGGHSLLMPGDIEKDAEKRLLTSQNNLTSTIIIAPHHGSNSSSSQDFLNQVAPQTVIYSASRFKKPHFPNKTVQARYGEIGADALFTAKNGAITVFFDREGLQTKTRK